MTTPAQQFVPIKEIRDGIVILKDGSLRIILMTSTINFSLKSQDEQQSILYQFQNFLNSLDFSIQIIVQSRKLDIRPYLNLLDERRKKQLNDLLKVQTREYVEFIKTFTQQTNIMTKRFYVVVPYSPTFNMSEGGILKKVSDLFGSKKQTKINNLSFNQQKSQLEERSSVVEQGLMRTGIRTARLGTDELTELYYETLNPGETDFPQK